MELLPLSAVVVIISTVARFIYKYLTRKSDVQISSENHAMKYLHNQMLFKDEKIERLLKELSDIKDDLAEQKRLIAILESTDWEIPCPYWIRNLDSEFVHANTLYLKFFNFKSNIIGKTLGDLFPEEVTNRFLSTDDEILKDNKDISIDEYEGALVIKWKQYAGKIVIGIAGILIPASSLSKDTILKLISYGEGKE